MIQIRTKKFLIIFFHQSELENQIRKNFWSIGRVKCVNWAST
jgi:hypothetical protein